MFVVDKSTSFVKGGGVCCKKRGGFKVELLSIQSNHTTNLAQSTNTRLGRTCNTIKVSNNIGYTNGINTRLNCNQPNHITSFLASISF